MYNFDKNGNQPKDLYLSQTINNSTLTYDSMDYKLIVKARTISPFRVPVVFITYYMIVANIKVSIHMCVFINIFDVVDISIGTLDCPLQQN